MNLRSTSLLTPLLLSASLVFTPARAQDWHPVGTGTATNGANGIPCPFGDIYAGQRAQYIYLASELSAAGLTTGDPIVRLRWVVTALNGSGMHENYTLRLGHTTAASLSGFLPTPTDATTTPRDHQPVVGNNDFTLNTPFVWDGTSNLLVEVTHFSPTYGVASANASVAFTSTAPVKRSYSLLDDLMYNTTQSTPLDGEVLNSTGLPNIVLGVAMDCEPLTGTDLSVCVGDPVPSGSGISVSGCTESLGGHFTAVYDFPGTDLECTGTDYVLRSTLTLPALPLGAVVQAGRLILTNMQAPDPVWMSDLYINLTGSIEGEIQLMPNHENYSGTVSELIVPMTGPYEAGVAQLSTASTYGTGYIGSARVEFDYLVPTPFWYDAPTGGNIVAYGQSTLDVVAEGLANTDAPGVTTLYADCGVSSTACISVSRTAVNFTVLDAPEPSFISEPEVVAGIATTLTYTGTTVSQYLWDFGDGNSSTAAEPTHVWDTPGTYTVQLTVDNGACDATISMDVTVDVNTGIHGTDGLAGMQVFATADAIIITQESNTGSMQVEVLDALGRTVISREHIPMSGRFSLPTAQLGTGVWYVRVTSTDGQRTFRVPLMR
ncbi:MAG: PKD domain-containing protein [Flavobacteriales bacterium]